MASEAELLVALNTMSSGPPTSLAAGSSAAAEAKGAGKMVTRSTKAAEEKEEDKVTELLMRLAEMQLKQARREPTLDFITVRGKAYTAHSAVMLLFWIALDACFALAGEELVPELFKLINPGSQAHMQLREFQQHIQRLYEAVQHLPTVHTKDPVKLFSSGLNKSSSREFAERYVQLNE